MRSNAPSRQPVNVASTSTKNKYDAQPVKNANGLLALKPTVVRRMGLLVGLKKKVAAFFAA
jgi:hypothetical protein